MPICGAKHDSIGLIDECGVCLRGSLEYCLTVLAASGIDLSIVPLGGRNGAAVTHDDAHAISTSHSPFFSVDEPPFEPVPPAAPDDTQTTFHRFTDASGILETLGISSGSSRDATAADPFAAEGYDFLTEKQRLGALLLQSRVWASRVAGRVVAPASRYATEEEVRQQLEMAGYLGLHAAIMPMRLLTAPRASAASDTASRLPVLNNAMVGVLRAFCQSYGAATKLWVECDPFAEGDWFAYVDLRLQLGRTQSLSDSEAREAPGVVSVNANTADGSQPPSWDVRDTVAPMLSFEAASDALSDQRTVLSSWLGEPVAAFVVPPQRVLDLLAGTRADPTMSSPISGASWKGVRCRHWAAPQPAHLPVATMLAELVFRRAIPIFCGPDVASSPLALKEAIGRLSATVMSQLPRCEGELSAAEAAQQHWATHRLQGFRNFEDVLQLPLQPLHHNLSSAVYATFEDDIAKYQRYRCAFDDYCRDWKQQDQSHWGIGKCRGSPPPHPSTSGEGSGRDCMYVVLLGGGRGPLLTELLLAASEHDITLHVFVIEKNPSAFRFLQLRQDTDPQWLRWVVLYGHTIELIHGDGRTLARDSLGPQRRLRLPPLFGWCDVVVSELLGSFGDNELSPECIDDFLASLSVYQSAKGIPENPWCTSIPQSYSSFLAPLYASAIADAVDEASRRSLSSLPVASPLPDSVADPHSPERLLCRDAHSAPHHSMFVCHVSRGVSLAPPQRCWTYAHGRQTRSVASHHTTVAAPSTARTARLKFVSSSTGVLTGLIGYFSATLYARSPAAAGTTASDSEEGDAVTLSTIPRTWTPGMGSWFPCVFAVPRPHQVVVCEGDIVLVDLRRDDDGSDDGTGRPQQRTRFWYAWRVEVERRSKESLGGVAHGGPGTTAPGQFINDGGWAMSFFL